MPTVHRSLLHLGITVHGFSFSFSFFLFGVGVRVEPIAGKNEITPGEAMETQK